jgi:hypothetical protein
MKGFTDIGRVLGWSLWLAAAVGATGCDQRTTFSINRIWGNADGYGAVQRVACDASSARLTVDADWGAETGIATLLPKGAGLIAESYSVAVHTTGSSQIYQSADGSFWLEVDLSRPVGNGSTTYTAAYRADIEGANVSEPASCTLSAAPAGALTRAAPALSRQAATALSDNGSNLYLLGTADGALGDAEAGAFGANNFYISKQASTGAVQWTAEVGMAAVSFYFPGSPRPLVRDGTTGNLYACGDTAGSPGLGNLSGTPGGSWETFAAAFSASGNLKWLEHFDAGSGSATLVTQCLVDPGGNLVVLGTTTGALGTELGTAGNGNGEAFLAQLSPTTGSPNWVIQVGAGSGTLQPTGISADANGNLYLFGSLALGAGSPFTELGTTGVTGQLEAFLVKITPVGNASWMRQFGNGTGNPGTGVGINGMLTDSSGNALLYGGTVVTGAPAFTERGTAGAVGANEIFLGKVDASGTALWLDQIGDGTCVRDAGISGVAWDPSGDILFTGTTSLWSCAAAAFPELGAAAYAPGPTVFEMILGRLHPDGTPVWIDQLGDGPGSAAIAGDGVSPDSPVFVDSADNLVFWGYAGDGSAPSLPELGVAAGTGATSREIVLGKVTPGGALDWAEKIGNGPATETWPVGMPLQDGSGNLYAFGYTTGTGFSELGSSAPPPGAEAILLSVTTTGASRFFDELGRGPESLSKMKGAFFDPSGALFLWGTSQNLGNGQTDSLSAEIGVSGALNWLAPPYGLP